jgi:alkyldihydroxyacetonephosphate synthase
MRRRSWWGWGYEDAALDGTQRDALAALVGHRLSVELDAPLKPPPIDSLRLPASRLLPPPALAAICDASPGTRILHARGRSFRDVVRNLHGDMGTPPDFVVHPRSEGDISVLLEWASERHVAVVPYGAGSSVVGGVEPLVGDGSTGAVTVDLDHLDRVLEIDATSRAARIQAGALGPAIEAQLAPHGLTLRHLPQSHECSTLGGWLATRSAGHFATLQTRIDDRVEALRVISPAGELETRRLPSSGAGPDPNRLFLGSEGTLGVISEAWLRVLPQPLFRASASVRFSSFAAGLDAVRALSQSGLHPANCRLLDPLESLLGGIADGTSAHLLIAFESADHPVHSGLELALELAGDSGGDALSPEHEENGDADNAGRTWRSSFLRAPYVRDALITLGLIVETFESAVTWDRVPALLSGVHEAAHAALRDLPARGMISCRITHAYPDGAAPYWTVVARGDPEAQVRQWDAIKAAVSEAIVKAGATITHHHAVGRDHRPWYDRERPDLFAAALQAAKHRLDPAGILNPGVLIG